MYLQGGLPRTARDFFFWITVAVLLLVCSLQFYQSQQYLRTFDVMPVCSQNGCQTPSGAFGGLGRRLGGMVAPHYSQAATASPERSRPPAWQEPSPEHPRLVVVVSSAPRSGSSFLGELLSSPRDALYFFEPFWYYKHKANKINSTAASDLHNLLTCNLDALPPMFHERNHRAFIWRKPKLPSRKTITRVQLTSRCRQSSVRVIKTIRPRLAQVLPLLQLEELGVHIVHLVRDPRAIHNSLLNQAKSWPERRLNVSLLCGDIRADVQAAQNVSSDLWTAVRYEDLSARPAEEALRLFHFLQLPLKKETAEFLRSHVKSADVSTSPRTEQDTARGNQSRAVQGKQQGIGEQGNGVENRGVSGQRKLQSVVRDQGKMNRLKQQGASERVRSSTSKTAKKTTQQNATHQITPSGVRLQRYADADVDVADTAITTGQRIPPPKSPGPPARSPGLSPARRPGFRRLTKDEYRRAVQRREVVVPKYERYYGTVRGGDFDRLHWIRELPPAEREKVEEECGDVLEALQYPLIYPQETGQRRQAVNGL